jgi:uncharacterized repeat protein (TIGR01451 family)
LDNTAQVAGNESDPVQSNNTSGHVTTTVNTEADLSIAKSGSPDAVVAGTTLTYTLVVTNNGPSNATGVVVSDTLPAGVGYVSAIASQGTCSEAGGVVTCNLNGLAVSRSVTVTIVARVASSTTGTLDNTAQVAGNESDPVQGNNTSGHVTTTVNTEADLSVTKSDSPDPVVAGTTLTYTLVYANNGPSDAQGVYITDTLPNEVIYRGVASTEPPLSNPSINGQRLTWAVPTLTAGASGSIVLTVTVNLHVSGILTNSVVITSSTPDSALDNNADDEETTVTTAASLYGAVFNDTNGNGNQDADETGISGARVTLDGTTTTTTDSNGHYTFFATAAGAHTLVETDLPGYRSTTPNTVVLNVTLGNSYRVDFGDVPTGTSETWASILGAVFHDANGNGVQDSGEVGLSGVTVTLDGATAITTDLYGRYSFSTTVAGVHAVVETDLPGYRSTTPNTVVLNVTLGNSYGVDFGDVPTNTSETWASILGAVFDDANGNGVQDSGEVGLSGVTVTLDGATAVTTDLYGRYSFSTTVAGVHAVVETDPPSYFSTTPNTVTLRVALGLSYQVNFGDAPVTSGFAAIYGTVFNDANANKTYDMNEEGIPGVLITLDGGITTTTNIYGGYSLTTTMPGQHLVTETDPPGYSSTTLNVIKVDVTLGRGYPVDFGDTTVSLCAPDTYEKDDSAALARGLGSSVQAHNFCEDATDWITFTAQANNVYTITTRAWGERADTILALYGTDGVTLLEMNDDHPSTTDFSSRMVWRAPANGVYYVQITNRGGLTGRDTDYELWKNEQVHYFIYLPVVMQNSGLATTGLSANSRLSPLGVITHTLPDAYEVDDTWQQAKPIVPGQVQTHTFDSPTSDYVPDKDYVRFRALPNSVVTFTVLSATGTVPTLELYGPTGDPYLVQGRWITRSLVLTWTVPDQQYYYLAAYDPGATIPATYALRMEGVPVLEMYLPVVMRIN